MSFWTNLHFVRPTSPPRVTVAELMRFASAVHRTGLTTTVPQSAKLMLGERIDADRSGTAIETKIAPGIYDVRDIEWSVEAETTEAVAALADDSRPVHRAFIHFGFGSLADTIMRALQTPTPDTGQPNLLFADVSIDVGPIIAGGLATDTHLVGWLSVGFGGNGYLWPWEPTDLLRHVSALPILQAVERVCRSTFPVTGIEKHRGLNGPNGQRRLRKIRSELGNYWPFPSDEPSDWAWAIHETG